MSAVKRSPLELPITLMQPAKNANSRASMSIVPTSFTTISVIAHPRNTKHATDHETKIAIPTLTAFLFVYRLRNNITMCDVSFGFLRSHLQKKTATSHFIRTLYLSPAQECPLCRIPGPPVSACCYEVFTATRPLRFQLSISIFQWPSTPVWRNLTSSVVVGLR